MSRGRLALVAALAATAAAGCSEEAPEESCRPFVQEMFSTRGDLVVVERERIDEEEVGKLPSTFTLDGDRVVVPLGVVRLELRRPLARGATTLSALDARVCARQRGGETRTCWAVEGTVDVLETEPACGSQACGALDLTLVIPKETRIVPRPIVHGVARLRWAEILDEVCS